VLFPTLMLLACDAPPEPLPPSIVLVTLDTTRADRLGIYGHEPAQTPTLDALAQEGLRFTRAFTTVPLTTPAHASMLTGLYPPRHGVRGNGDAVLPESLVTAPEVLAAAGYTTGASVAAFVTAKIWQLDQGFQTYREELAGPVSSRWHRTRRADQVIDDAIDWLDGLPPGPWFLWVHLYDPHAPYDPPPTETPLKDPYDGEIAFVDQQLARLFPIAQEHAGPEGLAWLIVGDHGEALTPTHGELEHGLLAFNDTMRVPLIVRPPTPLASPIVVSTPVSVADIAPTLCALARAQCPENLDGVDLLSETPRAPVYMESMAPHHRFGFHPERAVVSGHWKLLATPSPRLYDLDQDLNETQDLHAEHPDLVEELGALAILHASQLGPNVTGPGPEVLEQLRALGYIGHDVEASDVQSLDVKDHLAWIQELGQAQEQLQQGNFEVAKTLFEGVLAGPVGSSGEAILGLGSVAMAQGDPNEAARVFTQGLALSPDSSVLRLNLAQSLAAAGRFEEALTHVDHVLSAVPGDDAAQAAWLRMTTDLGQPEVAIEQARLWLAGTPNSATLQAHLGVALARIGESTEAEGLLRLCRLDGVAREKVESTLGDLALAAGDTASAVSYWETELSLFPEDSALWRRLATLLMELGAWERAGQAMGELAAREPEDLEPRRGQILAVFNTGDYRQARDLLDPLLAQRPDDPDLLLLHANLLSKEGRREEGKRVFEKAQALKRQDATQREDPTR
jgi:arylsulfatase A-like enzyme/tetratricopeptide (TPR) repeat protein